jgi:hypothetical protein
MNETQGSSGVTSNTRNVHQYAAAIRRAAAVLAATLMGSLLAGCDRNRPTAAADQQAGAPTACPPFARDGNVFVVPFMGLGPKLRVTAPTQLSRADGCGPVRLVGLDYFWMDGQLRPLSPNGHLDPLAVKAGNELARVDLGIIAAGRIAEAAKPHDSDWQYEGKIRHPKYPLSYLPRYYWPSPDSPPKERPKDMNWLLEGVSSPVSGRPYTLFCALHTPPGGDPDDIASREFTPGHGGAQCRGVVGATKGEWFISGRIMVDANGVADIDKIYTAAIRAMESMIQE